MQDKKREFIKKDKCLSFILIELNEFLLKKHFTNVALSGGTALSKCYKIIDRLSEDIDLIIFYDNQNNKLNKCKKIKENIDKYFNDKYQIVSKSNEFLKDSKFSHFEFVFKEIKFQVDIILKNKLPFDKIEVQRLHNVDNNNNIGTFSCINIENIFINKLIAFHNKFENDKTPEKLRIVRHIYDIAQIINKYDNVSNLIVNYDKYIDLNKDTHLHLFENKIFNVIERKDICRKIHDILQFELLNNPSISDIKKDITLIKKMI